MWVLYPIVFVACLIWFVLGGFRWDTERNLPAIRSHFNLVTSVVVFVIFLILMNSIVIIQAGHAGVITRFGRVIPGVRYPGLSFKLPLADQVLVYKTQRIIYETSDYPKESKADYTDYTVNTLTEDGQRIKVRFTVRFRLDPKKVGWIANNIGTESEVVEKIVKANARSEGRNVPKAYTARDLYTARVYNAQESITKKLRPVFQKNGVVLDELLLRDIGFEPELANALEKKQIAFENITTEERKIEQEKRKASQKIERAEGEKQAMIREAQGEAEAIRLKQEQLAQNPLVIQYVFAEGVASGKSNIQWGVLPQEMLPLVSLGTVGAKK